MFYLLEAMLFGGIGIFCFKASSTEGLICILIAVVFNVCYELTRILEVLKKNDKQ